MRVSRWGRSLAVRIPQSVVENLALQSGDEIELVVVGERSFEVRRVTPKDELLARMSELSAPLPAGYRFDRDDANER